MLSMTQVSSFRCFEGSWTFSTTSTGASDYIIIPPDVDRISAQLKVSSTASAVLEATCSTFSEIEAATAIWKEWDQGASTGDQVLQDATKGPVSAIRLNVKTALAGNNAAVSIRAQRGNP